MADRGGGPAQGSAFGLRIESDRPLPGLAAAPDRGEPEVTVRLGTIPEPLQPAAGSPPFYRQPPELGRAEVVVRPSADGAGLHFRFEDGCEVAVDREVRRVWGSWPPHLQLEDLAIYLLGPVLALALRRRGRTVLHASAVAHGGAAAALVGTAGAGKSTTAAALAGRGLRVVTDDVLALQAGPGAEILALPGPPLLRLWDDASTALYGAPDALPLLTPNWEKRFLDVAAQSSGEPLPLRTLYLLGGREAGATPRLEPVTPAEALMALIANTYHGWLSDPADRARDLATLGALVRGARLRRLVPADDRSALESLAAFLEHDLAAG